MIQGGTYLNIIDNSGAKKVCCLKVSGGYRRRYAGVGDLIVVSVKSLRAKRRATSKAKKGEIFKALVVRTKASTKQFSGENISFFENAAVLLTNQKKFVGTRVFGVLPKKFRYTKFLRLTSLSSGLIN